MFSQIDDLPSDEVERDLFLVTNFLNNVSIVTINIAKEFQDMTFDIQQLSDLSLTNVVSETFKKLSPVIIDLEREFLKNKLEFFKKFNDNGLTGESLNCKLIALDWLWLKAKDLFMNLKSGEYIGLFRALINQLKSLLKSILSSFGYSNDIFDEIFDLLISFSEMCNNEF